MNPGPPGYEPYAGLLPPQGALAGLSYPRSMTFSFSGLKVFFYGRLIHGYSLGILLRLLGLSVYLSMYMIIMISIRRSRVCVGVA